MHFRGVVHILGLLLVFLAVAMLIPIPFSLYYGGGDTLAFLISASLSLVVGLIAYKTTHLDEDLRPKEGFAVVSFSWLCVSLFGSLPFLISGTIPSFTDAFFETMSGFTTTGATILTDIERLPHGILLWRNLSQWIGGMGIIVLSLAVLPLLGVGGMQMFKAEIPGPVVDKLAPRVTETAKILWAVYALLTLVEVLLLWIGGLSFFDALCHTFSTVATGGFSTRNASIGAYNNIFVEYVVIVFMILSGTNFALHYRFLKGDLGAYWRSREFVLFLIILVSSTVFISFDTYRVYDGVGEETARKTLFQVLAILTGTGYGTADYELWSFNSQFLLLVLMMTGASVGSTSGGIKVMRIYLLVKFVLSEVKRLLHPQAVVPVRIESQPVSREVLANVMSYFVFFILLFILGVFIMTGLGLDFTSALGAVAATLGNVGPGLGSVGPTDNYAHIPWVGKWVLALLMLLGRLEIFTVIVLFTPDAWRK